MRSLIERYFYQLLEGCSDDDCQNINCKSSGKVALLTPNQAAAKALELFFQGASLCASSPSPCDKRMTTPQPQQTKNSGFGAEESSSSSAGEGGGARPANNSKPNCDKAERVASFGRDEQQDPVHEDEHDER